jgi:hypothetical protein
MTESEDRRRAVRAARTKNITGLILILFAVCGLILTSLGAIGWWTLPLAASVALGWGGWWLATQDVRAGTSPGTPGGPGTGTVVDTENPDPGAFIPGSPGDEPGTFYPPPPSRDSSRDFEPDPSRDRR